LSVLCDTDERWLWGLKPICMESLVKEKCRVDFGPNKALLYFLENNHNDVNYSVLVCL